MLVIDRLKIEFTYMDILECLQKSLIRVIASIFLITVLFSCKNKNVQNADASEIQNDFDKVAIELNDKAGRFMLDHLDSAIYYYKKSIQHDENYIVAYANLAGAYTMFGQLDSAILISEKHLKLEPLLAEAWISTGTLYEKVGEKEVAYNYYKKGIDLYTERIKSNPDKYFYENKLNRAVAYILIGKESLGQSEIEEVLSNDPDNPTVRMVLNMSRDELLQ